MTSDELPALTTPSPVPERNLACLLRCKLQEIKAFARRDPTQALVAALGVGLMVNLLPTRVVAGTVSTVGAAVLRPLLISLGIAKVIELTCNVTPLTLKP